MMLCVTLPLHDNRHFWGMSYFYSRFHAECKNEEGGNAECGNKESRNKGKNLAISCWFRYNAKKIYSNYLKMQNISRNEIAVQQVATDDAEKIKCFLCIPDGFMFQMLFVD